MKQTFYNTIPLPRSTILYNVVILVIGVFQWFTEFCIILIAATLIIVVLFRLMKFGGTEIDR